MVQSVEGIFKDGKVELLEPAPTSGESRVIITFLPGSNPIDLHQRNIAPAQAADLKARLKTFESDWNRPDMDAYDAL